MLAVNVEVSEDQDSSEAAPKPLDADGLSDLHHAVRSSNYDACSALLRQWPGLALQADHNGWLPVHEAVRARQTRLVELLLTEGDRTAQLLHKTRNGGNALFWAKKMLWYEMIEQLRSPEDPEEVTSAEEAALLAFDGVEVEMSRSRVQAPIPLEICDIAGKCNVIDINFYGLTAALILKYNVTFLSADPVVYLIEDFLTEQECAAMIGSTEERNIPLARSTGGLSREISDYRTRYCNLSSPASHPALLPCALLSPITTNLQTPLSMLQLHGLDRLVCSE